MIKFYTGTELVNHPVLSKSMFMDRAQQFRYRLGWDVSVDERGLERDDYDLPHTLYAISVDTNGCHKGSMRFLPTTGNTMISDHFGHILLNADFVSPHIWECTRFCLSEHHRSDDTALDLFRAGARLMKDNSLTGFVAVFDRFMERVYRRYEVCPEILGQAADDNGDVVKVGIWHNDNLTRKNLENRAGRSDAILHGKLVEPVPAHRQSAHSPNR